MSMKPELIDDVRRACATGVNRPLYAYWKARLEQLKDELLSCSEGQYKELRGRALEAQAFIKILEQMKEPRNG